MLFSISGKEPSGTGNQDDDDAFRGRPIPIPHELQCRIVGWFHEVQYKSVITLSDKEQNQLKHGYNAENRL